MTEDFREERAKSWDEFALRWLRMAWVFSAIAIGLLLFTVRYGEYWLPNLLLASACLAVAGYCFRMRRRGLDQAELLRSGRRT